MMMPLSIPVSRFVRALCVALPLLATAGPASALTWPQEVTAPEGVIVVYQPQPEKFEGNVLTGRAAMSLELADGSEPIFGAFWFQARIETDQDAGTAIVRDFEVIKVRWPESKDAGEQRFTAIVEGAIPDSGFEISLERLSASLATAEREAQSLEGLNNDPPKIVFREQLAVLLLYDGDPRYSKVENSDYERVMNTPFVVVRDGKGRYYLTSGSFWYEASDALGPWKPTGSPPADLVAMLPKPEDASGAPAAPPDIVVATAPTELVVSDGKPAWESLPGGDVLYVTNTETPWLRHLPTGNQYLLLSGRWFRAKVAEGPWTFVPADELPAAFANIPPDSDIGGLRTSVAGTQEAEDAVLDAQIPQTAAIDRKSASLTVEYDGKPKFEKIPGTSVSYAVNTAAQVLQIGKEYYAVDNGVWFEATSAQGPWQVADEVPEDEIAKIPPESPVYNTTHVHVYESTPEVVYVGYTPGYLWSFPYYGVPVYGTGWYYPPYYGPIYYPRPPTWGFHVGYNPWTGWNFGMSWSNGFFSMGVSWGGGWGGGYRPGGWYGGGGYRGPTVINTGDINIGNNINVGNRTRVSNRISENPGLVRDRDGGRNIYNRAENRGRKADPATVQGDLRRASEARGRTNDTFVDRDGNVARRDGDKWQSREDGQWRDDPQLNREVSQETRDRAAEARDNVTPEQRQQAADRVATGRENVTPAQRDQARDQVAQQQRDTSRTRDTSSSQRARDLDRASRARQSGARREASRPTRSAPRGGGARGGGRRR